MSPEIKRPLVLLDTLADTEAAMAILRRIMKKSKFLKIEVSKGGASATIHFSDKLMDITDAEAELLARLRAEE